MEIPDDRYIQAPERKPKPVAGTYVFTVMEATEETHKDGSPVLKLSCKADGTEWRLYERLYFTPKAAWFSKQKLKGLGVPEGLANVQPWMFIDTKFRAVCDVEKSKPNADGKVFDNLKVDIGEREGFHCGIQLVRKSQNMPATAADAPKQGDPFAQTKAHDPNNDDNVPF